MMKKRYIYLLLTVLYILAGTLCRAQENTMVRTRELADTLTIYFPLNQYSFDPSYMGNKVNMDRFIELNGVQNIVCRVTSSPEGPLSRNSFLTKMRAQSVADYINSHYDVSDDQVEISTADEAWEELEVLVRGSQMPWKDDVLAIFQNSPDTKKIELQRYDDGKVWEWMKSNWFPRLRQTLILVKTKEEKEVALIAKVNPPVGEIDLPVPESPGLECMPRVGTRPWDIPWDYLKSQIEDSGLVRKDEVIAILEEEARLVDYHHPNTHIDNRIVKLRALDDGKVWQQMHKLFFERMRNACAVFVTYKKELPPVQEPVIVPDTVVVEPPVEVVEIVPDTTAIVETTVPEIEEWSRKLYLKTNAIGLGMAIANVAAEIDLAKHWSFTLPVYYSAWDYFKSTVKFRTFAVQPEFRYWLSEENDGFFGGAHFGLAYYNFAFDGDYRYQDHNRETPSIGGGVSIGYRMPISKNNRWRVEFSLGAGVYSRHYDKFHNTPRTKDGLMIESIKKTYWGIDQAAVSFSYSFDLKKKGGKR